MDFRITAGTGAHVDVVADLWHQMLAHHRAVTGARFPMYDAEASWELARAAYHDWLSDGSAILMIATTPASSQPLGYVVCRLLASGPTFDLGPVHGEVDSLAVTDTARGSGIGTALLESVRTELLARGIAYWSIGVLADNTEAHELYRRLGFQPWTQTLLATTAGDESRPGRR